jgi:hypothetical protein
MRSRLKVLLAGAAMAVLLFAMAGVAWADHHRTPPGPPLRITDVAPDGGSTGVSTSPQVIVDFDMEMNLDTLNENVKVKRVGARRALATTGGLYTHDPDTFEVFLANPLEPNTSYKVIVDGGLDGVRSVDGGKLGGVDDPSARFRDGKVFWTFTTAP